MVRLILALPAALLLVAGIGLYLASRLRPYGIRTEVEIDASPDDVWEVLTDFGAHPEWNPFIVRAEGEIEAGRRLRVELSSGGRVTVFEPTVLVAEAGRELRWLGRFGIPGLVDGEHYFLIEEAGDGRARLIHGEMFTGVAVPLARRALDVEADFTAMNSALKQRVETMPRLTP
ncbi:hypothetical protein HNR23_003811 [Nocardiopsis mwathae]|uniref:SRPBCC domain-containing protein n=1 Tax=Nocardiopsis mwathae TaxID=1472723 RepID=A0A7X0D7I2_9ACTN|nr:SRPBCC domain-containing protein [Nocardiopsis mwathae]MBB6173751.1 hypothetical protein [Nocardiopsis mwathae]